MTFLQQVQQAAASSSHEDHASATAYLRRRSNRVRQRAAMGIGVSHTGAFRKDGDTLILDMLTGVPPIRGAS